MPQEYVCFNYKTCFMMHILSRHKSKITGSRCYEKNAIIANEFSIHTYIHTPIHTYSLIVRTELNNKLQYRVNDKTIQCG